MSDSKEIREKALELIYETNFEKAIFDTEKEHFAFKQGAEYGVECAIVALMEILKSKDAA